MLLLRQPFGEPEYVDLGVIGVDDQFQTEEEARTVEHLLNDGSYVIDITGRQPARWTLTGNCITRGEARPAADGRINVVPQNELAALSRLMGRWVEVSYYDAPILGYVAPYVGNAGTAFIKRVRTTGRIILGDEILYSAWSLELVFADSRAEQDPDVSLTRQLQQNMHGKVPALMEGAAMPAPGGGGGTPTPQVMTLSFDGPPNRSLAAGTIGTVSWPVATGGTPPYTYSLPTLLSPGFTFDLHTRRLIWDDTLTPGEYEVVMRVVDSASPPATRHARFLLTVTAPITALAWDFDWDDVGASDVMWLARVVNGPYTILPKAENGVPPYTYSIANAPGGVVIDPMNGNLSSTVRLTALGRHPITLTATDRAGTSISQRFWLRVNPN